MKMRKKNKKSWFKRWDQHIDSTAVLGRVYSGRFARFLFFSSLFSFLALKIRATNCFDWATYLSTRDFCFCAFFLELVLCMYIRYGCSYSRLMTARRLAIALFSTFFFLFPTRFCFFLAEKGGTT